MGKLFRQGCCKVRARTLVKSKEKLIRQYDHQHVETTKHIYGLDAVSSVRN